VEPGHRRPDRRPVHQPAKRGDVLDHTRPYSGRFARICRRRDREYT
jgi:hypothetical protein